MGSLRNRGTKRSRKARHAKQRKDYLPKSILRQMNEAQRKIAALTTEESTQIEDETRKDHGANEGGADTQAIIDTDPIKQEILDTDQHLLNAESSDDSDNEPLIKKVTRQGAVNNPWADLFVEGLRYVDFNILAWKMWCKNCDEPLSLRNMVCDKLDVGELDIRCLYCESVICVPLIDHKKATSADPEVLSTELKVEELNIQDDDGNESDSRSFDEAAVDMACDSDSQGDQENHHNGIDLNTDETEVNPEDLLLPEEEIGKIRLFDTNKKVADSLGSSQDIEVETGSGKLNDSTNIKKRGTNNLPQVHPSRPALTNRSLLEKPIWLVNMQNPDDFDYNVKKPGLLKTYSRKGPIVLQPLKNDQEEETYKIPKWACKKLKSFPYRCGYCFKNFEKQQEFYAHRRESHPEYLEKVCWCGLNCQSEFAFRSHIAYKHDQRAQCHECGLCFSSTYKLILHNQEKHEVVTKFLTCKLCHKKFKSETQMRSHAKTHRPASYQCHHCVKKFNCKIKLRLHMALHTKDFKFFCPICPSKFTRPDNMRNHIKNNHNYVCSICPEVFTSALAAKEHVKQTHSEEEVSNSGIPFGFQRITKFACTECGMCLATQRALQFHSKRHLKETLIADCP